MAGTTISTSTTVGVSLTAASQNPVTVTSTGTVNVSGTNASAIYGAFGVPGTIANDGLLAAANGYGIKLVSGGTITNGSATDTKASISGGLYGVRFNIHGAGTLSNFGTITNTSTTTGAGVRAFGDATIVNGSTADTSASISGYFEGVRIAGSAASVINFGKIAATGTSTTIGFGSFGIYFQTGGKVTNGSNTDTAASITGVTWGIEIEQAPGTIANFGTIKGTGSLGRGIVLGAGGSVTNGSSSDTAAYIAAASRNGIYIGGTASSTVSNFGTIKSLNTITTGIGNNGIAIRTGGTVTNGTATDTKALISGGNHGVYIEGALPSAVINFGTIASSLGSSVSLYLGGNITNGSASDTKALISGSTGVYVGGPATVTNFGTMISTGTHSGIVMEEGGSVTNGSAADTTALIAATATVSQHSAIYNRLNQATITNFGTIKSVTASAIHLNAGGTIVNGTTVDTTALIVGSTTGSSIYIQGSQVAISNFATIGSSAVGASGIFLGQGGTVTNGSAADTKAAIIAGSGTAASGIFISSGTAAISNFGTVSGHTAITMSNGATSATGTVVNFGSIVSTAGAAGTAIRFGSGTERLVLHAGSSITGKVFGGSGSNTLELASGGAGTTGSIGSQFLNFGTVVVDAGASWTLTGTNTMGTVTNNGTLAVGTSSTLDVTGAVSPGSTGLFQLNSASVLEVLADTGAANKMQFLGAGEVIVDKAANFGTNVGKTTYTGPLIENFGTAAKIDLKDVSVSGSVLNYASATGLLQITQGSTGVATLAFQNSSLGTGTFHSGNDGTGHLLLTHS